MTRRSHQLIQAAGRLLVGGAALALLAVSGPVELAAQECAAAGERPYVCAVDLFAGPSGERLYALEGRWAVQLEFGQQWELELEARDQWDRRFPRERLALGVEPEERCRGLVTLDERGPTAFTLRAAATQGDCRVWLWIPGNLNLEWSLDVRVVSRAGNDYSRSEAEKLAAALYRGLLDREPDPNGLAGTTAEIQRGNLAEVIRSIAASPEYRSRIAGKPATEILEQLYSGLLGRSPDSEGVRLYLGAIQRGDVVDIVWRIVKSPEFERRLTGVDR